MSDVLLNEVLDSIFKVNNAGGPGGGLLGSIFGVLGGGVKVTPGAGLFSEGGYIGQGGKYHPAGIVYKGEYVIPKATLDKMGVGGIQSMLGGYTSGGLVGMRPPSMPSLVKSGNSGANVNITLSPVIDNRGASVEAVARTEQALARMKAELPSTIVQTIRKANKTNVKLH